MRPLRAEQHEHGGEHGEHAEQPEDERDGVRRRAVDAGDVGIAEPTQHERERPADAVLRGAQRAREQLQQAPAEEAAEDDDAEVEPRARQPLPRWVRAVKRLRATTSSTSAATPNPTRSQARTPDPADTTTVSGASVSISTVIQPKMRPSTR